MTRYKRDFDMKGSGDYVNETAGETLGNHKLVYRGIDGYWYLADADAAATMPVLGITMGAIPAGRKGEVLLDGYIGDSAWTWTGGAEVYASTIAGELTAVAPIGVGDIVQVVAIAVDANIIQFTGNIGGGHGGSNTLEGYTAYVGFDPSKSHFVNYWCCDGVADNVQIQAAIDYCEALGRGTIFIESGVYAIASGLTLQHDGVSLLGENEWDTIFDPVASIICLTVGVSGSRTWYNRIENLNFDGAGAIAGTDAIKLYSPNSCILKNLYMEDFYQGIVFECNTVNGTYCYLENVDTLRVMISYEQNGTASSNGNTFVRPRFQGWAAKPVGSIGINIEVGDTSKWISPQIENYETGINLAGTGDSHGFFGVRMENATNGIVIAATVANCDFVGGNLTTVTTMVTDAGTNNNFDHVHNYLPSFPTIFIKTSDPDTVIGTHPAVLLPDGADTTVYEEIILPTGILALESAEAIIVPGGTGNLRRSAASNFGEIDSEAYNNHTDSIAAGQIAVTLNVLESIDISALFTSVAAEDLIGFSFTREGSNVNDTVNADCYYLGVRIRYVGG